jgi:transposase
MELTSEGLAWFFETVTPHLGERQRRIVAGAMAEALGHGGQARVAEASAMSTNTLWRATKEVREGLEVSDRERRPGAGDKPAIERQPGLLEALDELVHPQTRGNPMSMLRWTSKSTYELADELVRQGFRASSELVRRLLHQLGYSLQAPAKAKEGTQHPDRDAQFRYLNDISERFTSSGQPVISVDTKKKELVGEYANGGREWQPKGEPVEVKTHDFIDPEAGKAVPYGVYDVGADEGWVSVGDSADTSAFAVEAIRRWWDNMGAHRYPKAKKLLITADAGGSNGYRPRAWKVELAKLATETGLEITCCHYPPGTSKWNKIEHRMFSFMTMNWRGRPLVSFRTIIESISSTKTRSGLRLRAERDWNYYETGRKVTEAELAAVPLTRHEFHGDWNYTIKAAA